LTIGILIFQDIWVLLLMALQPHLDDPNVSGYIHTFGMMALLLIIAFSYAKFVLPAVFSAASSSVELLLVLAMAWCFFICCIALLPFVDLTMELAALIAGISMATYPYSTELNSKIKYIRDYFICLYFVSLGMQIPVPTVDAVGKAVLACLIVLSVRWAGLFVVVELLERDDRLAVVATMNLSQASEFGLVLCSLGKSYQHVDTDTFTIMIWTFAILAVSSSYYIKYNHAAYVLVHRCLTRIRSNSATKYMLDGDEPKVKDNNVRDIVLLGFSKIANALVVEVQERCPALLSRMHVIDASMKFKKRIEKKGVSFACGDIGSADVMRHAMPKVDGRRNFVKLILITNPDSQLGKHTNSKLLSLMRGMECCNEETKVICTAEHTADVARLYSQGANYVLKMVKLSAERLADMLEQYAHGMGGAEFNKDHGAHHNVQKVLANVLGEEAKRDKARERRVSEVHTESMLPKKSHA